jgi:chemotaxis protein histidine kinase CheA
MGQDAVARAEAALKALAGQFAGWLQDEIRKLDAARARITADGLDAETCEAFYLHAHDLKGLGGTYGFPIVTRIAGSLCRLIDDTAPKTTLSLALVDAHIDAIKMMVREDVRDSDSLLADAIVKELEAKVAHAAGRSS